MDTASSQAEQRLHRRRPNRDPDLTRSRSGPSALASTIAALSARRCAVRAVSQCSSHRSAVRHRRDIYADQRRAFPHRGVAACPPEGDRHRVRGTALLRGGMLYPFLEVPEAAYPIQSQGAAACGFP